MWGYLPEVYLTSGRSPTGRYANYLALRVDTAPPSARMIRIPEYAADVGRASAIVREDTARSPMPAQIEAAIQKRMVPLCVKLTDVLTLDVVPRVVDRSQHCVRAAAE
jgi:hypothetical protein